MSRDYKKDEKNLYQPKDDPTIVTVPAQRFFCIKGRGNPNGPDFAERLGVLYSLAYAVRMMPKGGFTPDGYEEYRRLSARRPVGPVGRGEAGRRLR
ncbi:MAG: hypothetical protein M0C28_18490 [Candidatus Moduliflexus flocculans]|nr:hypothetical protein [Candidatus Moduliflexus flocculans]